VKPIKFAVSITVFTSTLGWLLGDLGDSTWARRIDRLTGSIAIFEMTAMGLQAARGLRSHYNLATLFDGTITMTMLGGVWLIAYLIARAAHILFTRPPALGRGYLWGMRLGMLLFVTAGLQGMVMVIRFGHGVGVVDGGPGVAVLNWSTRGGDFRVAHAFGLHALQLLPLLGAVADRAARRLGWLRPAAVVGGMTALLVVGMVLTFVQAALGRPFWS
jgi:hypothetical protein